MARLKQRLWLYMDMTYFRSMFGFRRLRRVLYLLAPIAAAAWITTAAVKQDLMPYSSGEMSAMHGHFAHDCGQCHADSWAAFQPTVDKDHALNQRCLACHGPTMGHDPAIGSAWHVYTGADHAGTMESEVGCSSCHLEHQGRETLTQVPDPSCTICHEDMGPILRGRPLTVVGKDGLKIASFEPDGGHPELKMFQGGAKPVDPGTVAFSHHFHMMPGAYDPRPDVLAKAALQCDDCHRAGESAQPFRFAGKTREAHRLEPAVRGHSEPELQGEFMHPVRYSLHCADCHPLSADRRLTGSPSVAAGTVPHERPGLIRSYLTGQLLALAAGSERGALDWPDGRIPLPRRLESAEADETSRLMWVRDEVAKIERQLYGEGGACLKCHTLTSAFDFATGALVDVQDPAIPARWLRHASFDHSVHRAESQCLDCHREATDPSFKLTRWDGSEARGEGRDGAEAVMMPRLESCRECHGKLRSAGEPGRKHGGIVATCATCHTYHRPLEKSGGFASSSGGAK